MEQDSMRTHKKKQKKKIKDLTKFVIFSFTCLIVYTIVSQVIAYKTASFQMPVDLSTLTTCFFAAFGGEVLICALMKLFKLRRGGNESDDGSEEETDIS